MKEDVTSVKVVTKALLQTTILLRMFEVLTRQILTFSSVTCAIELLKRLKVWPFIRLSVKDSNTKYVPEFIEKLHFS